MTARSPHFDADESFQQELETGPGSAAETGKGSEALPGQLPGTLPRGLPGGRFNVLLTEDRAHAEEHWTHQVPRLLEPLGIRSQVVASGAEALAATQQTIFHAAVIDLATPTGQAATARLEPPASGLWLLEVLKRHDATPPTIVINAPAAPRQTQRLLNQALRLGAFAVINRPVQLNTLLGAIQRILERHHQNHWPDEA